MHARGLDLRRKDSDIPSYMRMARCAERGRLKYGFSMSSVLYLRQIETFLLHTSCQSEFCFERVIMMAVPNPAQTLSVFFSGLWGMLATAAFLLIATVQNAGAAILEVEIGGEVVAIDLVSDLPPDLPLTSYRTNTVWTEDADIFTGVLLEDFLRHLGVHSTQADPLPAGATVTLQALDGYSATLTFPMLRDDRPLLAFRRNDQPMSRREQGPYWVIFDYDSDVRFRTETYYALSVWQIERIVISD